LTTHFFARAGGGVFLSNASPVRDLLNNALDAQPGVKTASFVSVGGVMQDGNAHSFYFNCSKQRNITQDHSIGFLLGVIPRGV
jgi:hypothetical protein